MEDGSAAHEAAHRVASLTAEVARAVASTDAEGGAAFRLGVARVATAVRALATQSGLAAAVDAEFSSAVAAQLRRERVSTAPRRRARSPIGDMDGDEDDVSDAPDAAASDGTTGGDAHAQSVPEAAVPARLRWAIVVEELRSTKRRQVRLVQQQQQQNLGPRFATAANAELASSSALLLPTEASDPQLHRAVADSFAVVHFLMSLSCHHRSLSLPTMGRILRSAP
jgi:hypothetical protein